MRKPMTKVVGFFFGANGLCLFAIPVPAVRCIFSEHFENLNVRKRMSLPSGLKRNLMDYLEGFVK